jgi:mevalonate kinase
LNGFGERSVTATAPGKVIVLGEHFVVHGSYAIAAAISKRAKVTVSDAPNGESIIISDNAKSKLSEKSQRFSAVKAVVRGLFADYGEPHKGLRIEIQSEIPIGSGLGSSAAISVATGGAVSRFMGHSLSNEELAKIATRGEKSVHGNPSGIDTSASLYGGMILFSRKAGPKPVPLNRALQLLIVYSGVPRSTSKLISRVEERKSKFPSTFNRLADAFSFASLQLVDALSSGDLPYVGALMNFGQASLSWIGVSTNDLDKLVENVLHDDSCYGAKLTGAGGGGSIIALPIPEKAGSLQQRISRQYRAAFLVSIPQKGLSWE